MTNFMTKRLNDCLQIGCTGISITFFNRILRFTGVLFLFAVSATAAWSDTVVGVTSQSGLSANDSVNWSQLGGNGTLLGATVPASSGKGLAVTGSLSGANSITAKVCTASPCSWRGAGFKSGDTLIWTSDAANAGNGPLTFNFAKKISGAGTFIQADGPGVFTAQIQAFNGGTSLGTFAVNSSANGNAAYIGILDQTGANITSVVFSLTSCTGACSDFAIDTLDLNTGSGTSFALTVSLVGTGSGSVTSSPAGISCPSTCTANFNSGTTVTLTASAANGSTFAGWSGACSGTGTCTATMNAAQSVTATFNAAQLPLAVSLAGTGNGTVTSSPAGISCPSTCSASFNSGTTVTLTASAANGSTFAGWSGACSGTGSCTVTMNAAKSVTATFNSGQSYALKLTLPGTGTGSVTSSPAGINCPSTCSVNYVSGTIVTLTAKANPGSIFFGWGGACTGKGTCSVTMNTAMSVKAKFTLVYPLTVTKVGTGKVKSTPAGINCGTICSYNFKAGTVVTLTETPGAGHTFGGWSGACSGLGSCTVAMSAAESVKATFN